MFFKNQKTHTQCRQFIFLILNFLLKSTEKKIVKRKRVESTYVYDAGFYIKDITFVLKNCYFELLLPSFKVKQNYNRVQHLNYSTIISS